MIVSVEPPNPLVTVIGAGPVGVALAGKLMRVGVPVAALYGRTLAQAAGAGAEAGVLGCSGEVSQLARSANVVIVAVADDRVAEAVEVYFKVGLLHAEQIVFHTCGAWAAGEVLSGIVGKVRAVGTLHPLASISSRKRAFDRLTGASFGVEGEIEAVAMAERLVALMGGHALHLKPSNMPLYHAGAALASNAIVAVMDLARRAFEAADIPSEAALVALVPLLRSAADNLEQLGLPMALTGPVSRGDVTTVQRHLAALDRAVPDVAARYREIGHEILAVAERKSPGFDPAIATQLRSLFAPKV